MVMVLVDRRKQPRRVGHRLGWPPWWWWPVLLIASVVIGWVMGKDIAEWLEGIWRTLMGVT
jgi:hypothetical protein